MGNAATTEKTVSPYRALFRNRSFLSIWTGRTVSTFGDACFNVAVLWIVFAESNSVLRTALVQVVWQLSDVVIGPFAGVLADRWDRKRILIAANLFQAIVVSILGVVAIASDSLPLIAVLLTIFGLNAFSAFIIPASAAVTPSIVPRELLATAGGFAASTGQLAFIAGSAIAGALLAAVTTAWALFLDAATFLVAAFTVAMARIPRLGARDTGPAQARPSMVRDLRDGWAMLDALPGIKPMIWLSTMINVASVVGVLFPALVRDRLDGGAEAFGVLTAAGVVGGLLGGFAAGPIERRFGAGQLVIAGFVVAGACTLGVALSIWFALTLALEVVMTFALTIGSVAMGAVFQAVIPNAYMGRAMGIIRSLSVVTIPVSALLGGWVADMIGVVPVYFFAGLWVIGCAAIGLRNPRIRQLRI